MDAVTAAKATLHVPDTFARRKMSRSRHPCKYNVLPSILLLDSLTANILKDHLLP